MKQIYSYILKFPKSLIAALFLIPLFWSCHFLDYTEYDSNNENYIFSYIDQTKTVLANVYSYLPKDYNSVDGAIRSSATDDAEHVWDASAIQRFNNGGWSAINPLDDQWGRMYTAIKAANIFLDKADTLTFPAIKYAVNYADLMKALALYPYEARFLRAMYYFELIKRYGNVPLDTVRLTPELVNNVKPNSYDEIVKFIVRECDSAAIKLPITFSTFISKETGRATKGAAMALKARTLLYAASPLHNSSNAAAKWIAAASASKALIDQLGATYTPLAAYNTTWNNLTSKELILETRQADDRAFEAANTAVGYNGGNTGTCPTQNLIDAYDMKTTGKGITEAGSGYDPANPYSTSGATARDPRLDMTILRNGSIWKNPLVIQTFQGGLNAAPRPNTTKTGYYIKKFMVESIVIDPSLTLGNARHVWPIFRYAEVLLNYAEAMNEVYGPDGAGPAPLDNLTARAAVNIVRARTGVAMPAFAAGMTQSTFRDKLRNERRVELAFEDHRFWDIRRWKIGPSATIIKGVDLTRDPVTGVITYTPKVVETRVWNDKMYLYPIPETELFINKNLVQNLGW
ncbi:MAG: RagB/SusD family nutrient uptake outer membrane protein [Lentimicrobiaceae bacterium]|nr:RagB/SusD family nutrient uptake outer membrane protein [Lentimicrobiaceae bacterium]